ncbi:MAG TPA: TIGR00341 family protein [Chitinophaga sp.]|uniref:TIGR00341 family protein n=1 Tax=Chitinophaga sp. TaxID=1869181 RepID=UPI002B8E4441|nr:TIGR00341 family protein [Chitinophaga sp.]HVI45925.1 TIGR00341 family protein [Chitinophaga sp.]
MKQIFSSFIGFLSSRFNLHEDKAEENEITASIRKNVDFRGANLWALIFAILIASIGLNVNSTGVIIGAMLISPLMGPIMGIGLGIGINDFDLVKKGLRNLAMATFISIATSSLYFWITPLHEAQSELLARTTPSVWDVFIALFGGLAGIVAGTRREKSNVIPGVAIATALMPPLCTAGFGLANGNFYYFLGALYLYFINSVFICISTFLIVRFLGFNRKEFEDKKYEKKVSRYILLIVIITTLPSIYLAYRIVEKSIFENNARKFVQEQFQFSRTQVVNRVFRYNSKGNEIDLLLIGNEISPAEIDALKNRMVAYKLGHCRLIIRQGLNAKQEIDLAQIKASILEDVYRKDSGSAQTTEPPVLHTDTFPDLRAELRTLYPGMQNYTLSKTTVNTLKSQQQDTVTLLTVSFDKPPGFADRLKLQQWIKYRLKADTVKLIIH